MGQSLESHRTNNTRSTGHPKTELLTLASYKLCTKSISLNMAGAKLLVFLYLVILAAAFPNPVPVSLTSTSSPLAEQEASLCQLPKARGICRALIPSFYFEPITMTCQDFTYSGCWGNGNRFSTIEECERACK